MESNIYYYLPITAQELFDAIPRCAYCKNWDAFGSDPIDGHTSAGCTIKDVTTLDSDFCNKHTDFDLVEK
ncbi:MAG: hypothetical protein GY853_14450 [PVC group bacterium]|nr:hypothetical protein [PVC group bacterium]